MPSVFRAFLLVAALVCASQAQKTQNKAPAPAAPAGPYTSKYDNFDVDSVLKNDKILKNYINCMLDKGPCTNEGRELKKYLPDAIATDCTKCNERQKATSEKVIRHLIKFKAAEWSQLLKKYDPTGAAQKRYEKFVTDAKI